MQSSLVSDTPQPIDALNFTLTTNSFSSTPTYVAVGSPDSVLHLTSLPASRVITLDPELLNQEESGLRIIRIEPEETLVLENVEHTSEVHSPTRAPSSFHWVIANSREESIAGLNHVCLSLIDRPFSELTITRDSGQKKAHWFKDILNCHVTRFNIDPDNPLKIKRELLELLLAPDGLVTVDQSGRADYLHKLRLDIENGKIQRREASCYWCTCRNGN